MILGRYSVRELLHRPLRTLLALIGVSVATAMLADMLMLGSGIQRSFTELLSARGYELRISPRGTLPFDTEAEIENVAALRAAAGSTPGVDGVAPVLASSVLLAGASPGSSEIRAFALGIDMAEQGVLRIIEGRAAMDGELLVSRSVQDSLGVTPGDAVSVRVSGGLGVAQRRIEMRVSGIADFLYSSRDEVPIALSLPDLQALSARGDVASFAMVSLEDDADPEAVARGIADRVPTVSVTSVAGLVEQANERLSYFRQLALILGSVSLVVTSLLVGTIMAVSISERAGIIAALRAIGISRRSIIGGLTAESLILCVIAAAAGLGLGVVVAGYLESILSDFPGLPEGVEFFVLRPRELVVACALLLTVGALSALFPAWRATRMEVASLLHVEEP